MNEVTIERVVAELLNALRKHPEGPNLAAVLKKGGDLARVLIFENRQSAGVTIGPMSIKAKHEAVKLIVILVRMIEGI